jgi:spore coat protein CotH
MEAVAYVAPFSLAVQCVREDKIRLPAYSVGQIQHKHSTITVQADANHVVARNSLIKLEMDVINVRVLFLIVDHAFGVKHKRNARTVYLINLKLKQSMD